MPIHHPALIQPLRSCGADVVLPQLFQHCGPHHACQHSCQSAAQRNGRQHQIEPEVRAKDPPSPRTGHRQPTQPNGEDQDQDRPQRKVRERQSPQRGDAQHAIRPAPTVQSRDNARRHGHHNPNRQRRQRKRQRIGITLPHQVRHGVVQAQRLTKVGVEYAPPVAEVLRVEGRVQAIRVPQHGDIGGRRAFAQHLHHRIPRHQVDEQKHHRNHHPQHGER